MLYLGLLILVDSKLFHGILGSRKQKKIVIFQAQIESLFTVFR